MRLDLIFPPVHDPAMPHSALPLLKAYLHRESDHQAVCHDLNWDFFCNDVLGGSHQEILNEVRTDFVAASSATDGVRSALKFEAALKGKFDAWSDRNDGYSVSFRYFSSPYDRRDPISVRSFAESNSTPFDDTIGRIQNELGPAAGINLSVEDQILPAFRLARLIRTWRPDGAIIWGGSLLSRIYPALIEHFGDLWDFLVIREGEEPLAQILADLTDDGDRARNDDRIISRTTRRTFDLSSPFVSKSVTDISSTGYADFDDYKVDEYLSIVPMLPALGSRKCYWGRCSFCTIHESWDPKARQRTSSDFAKELQWLTLRHGIRSFRFVDEAFPPNMLKEMLPIVSGLNIKFEIYAIAESRFKDADFVQRLGASGCTQAYFGLESADPKTLEKMGKKINQHRSYSTIFNQCATSGVHVYVYTLFGFPGSSIPAEEETERFITTETAVQTATIGTFVPVVGSPFAANDGQHLVHNGRMTEDYEGAEFVGLPAFMSDATSRAADTISRVYSARPDLALNALLNDEMRFALSSRFGSDYAIQVINSGSFDVADIMRRGAELMRTERVSRTLDG